MGNGAYRIVPPIFLFGVKDGEKVRKQKLYGRRTRSPKPKQIIRESGATVEGIFSGTRSRFGFVSVEGMEEDIFIPAGKTCGAIDGDRVRVRYRRSGGLTYERGTQRYEGTVLAVTEITRRSLIGTYLAANRFVGGRRAGSRPYLVVPDDPRLSFEVPVPPHPDAHDGDKVEIRLIGRQRLEGEVVRIFGPASSREANYGAILASAGIQPEFEPEAEREAERLAARPLSCDGRVSYEGELIFTIDGAGAKDLDDAVSLRRLAGGKWLLGVHIADVSEYVQPKTPLDRAAMARGTSVYFTDRVVPMLPPALSNGACSLNAGEPRYALSARMTLDERGNILSTRVEKSVICSRVRGVYDEVNALLSDREGSEHLEKYREVLPSLLLMQELYAVLAKKSEARGALSLEHPEAEILLGEDGLVSEIVRRERGIAERMIEQFMLTANEGVARLLHERGIPCVYRIHEDPPHEKLCEFALYARNLGFDTRPITEGSPSAGDFAALLCQAREQGLAEAISYPLLRALSKARYSEYPRRHFGLGLDLYCHFTSPIRRLSDLATHRILKAVLLANEPRKKYEGYARRAAAAASEAELRALDAERRIEAMYKALYLSRFLGEEFPARISSVTGWGIFAELENTCEGLIPIASLPGLFIYDERSLSLSCGRRSYRLGDQITVRVEDVDAMQGKVTFALVEE